MRATQLLISTLKETPADAEVISHQLLLRAGMIRKLEANGLYNWLPLGLKVLRKVEKIIREEMDKSGAQEVLMPVVQPADLWIESKRWEYYGAELLRFKDRHDREFCLGPTHEEVITDIARRELRSYKQLPINFYQIQTKFRDEVRPRFGIMRAREFIMKDAYSFHLTQESLQQTYDVMYETYSSIFSRLGLQFRAVLADTGSIGGNKSHEFHVIALSGEDAIAYSDQSNYAANVELAEAISPVISRSQATQELKKISTPNQHSIEDVSNFLNVSPEQCLKTLIVYGKEDGLVALVLRGDHQLNVIKAAKHELISSPVVFASNEEIKETIGCEIGSIGIIDLKIPMIVDRSALQVTDFVCGANEDGFHLTGVNWGRDLPEPTNVFDLRNVVENDPSPDGKGHLKIARGIEVGHIFQLGEKYSSAMQAKVLDETGRAVTMTMGCYGIGVTRVVAAAIEQNHDEKGIIWHDNIAPYQIVLTPMNMYKSKRLEIASEELYKKLIASGFEVLFDDRKERAGVMFADWELIGIPHRLVISDKGLDEQTFEYKGRRDKDAQKISADQLIDFLKSKIGNNAM